MRSNKKTLNNRFGLEPASAVSTEDASLGVCQKKTGAQKLQWCLQFYSVIFVRIFGICYERFAVNVIKCLENTYI